MQTEFFRMFSKTLRKLKYGSIEGDFFQNMSFDTDVGAAASLRNSQQLQQQQQKPQSTLSTKHNMNNNTEASCSPGARVRSLPPIIFSQPNAPGNYNHSYFDEIA